ncbi:MAG: YdcF family protein [Chloroflexota bacterium]|nr:YdcF family protein [Chloroflexota bacterium]
MSKAPRQKYVAARPVPISDSSRLGPRRWAYHQPVHTQRSIVTLARRLLLSLLLVLLLGGLSLVGFTLWVDTQTSKLILDASSPQLGHHHVAIVFGAGLNKSGGPSPMLYDRIATAVDLYKAKKVDKLLMTGDNAESNHEEVRAMHDTALQMGVPEADIVPDYAGFSTWDSCYRAREVFSVSDVVLVTQRFHLPRALFVCNYLHVQSVGVIADRQSYPTQYNELREWPALAGTVYHLLVDDKPKLLAPRVNVDAPTAK